MRFPGLVGMNRYYSWTCVETSHGSLQFFGSVLSWALGNFLRNEHVLISYWLKTWEDLSAGFWSFLSMCPSPLWYSILRILAAENSPWPQLRESAGHFLSPSTPPDSIVGNSRQFGGSLYFLLSLCFWCLVLLLQKTKEKASNTFREKEWHYLFTPFIYTSGLRE